MIYNQPIYISSLPEIASLTNGYSESIRSIDNVFFPGTTHYETGWPGGFCIAQITDQSAGTPGYCLFAPIIVRAEDYPTDDTTVDVDFVESRMHFYFDKDATSESSVIGFLAKTPFQNNPIFGQNMPQISSDIFTAFAGYEGDHINDHFIHVIVTAWLHGTHGSTNPYIEWEFEQSTRHPMLKWLCPCIEANDYVVPRTTEEGTSVLTYGVQYKDETIDKYNFIDPEDWTGDEIWWGYEFDTENITPPTFTFEAYIQQLSSPEPTPTNLEQRVAQLEADNITINRQLSDLDSRVTALESGSVNGHFVSV